jgi:hypothetical protein
MPRPHTIQLNIDVRPAPGSTRTTLGVAQAAVAEIVANLPEGCQIRDFAIKAPPRPR